MHYRLDRKADIEAWTNRDVHEGFREVEFCVAFCVGEWLQEVQSSVQD